MIFWNISFICNRLLRGGGGEKEGLFYLFRLGVVKTIFDLADQRRDCFVGVKAVSLPRQLQSLPRSMLTIGRDEKRKRRRLTDYTTGLADLLGLKFLEL